MSGVDDRVVSMKFDNAAFEANMADTLKSLDKLKASLNFSDAQKNMGDLENAGKNFNLGGMGNAAEGISAKFLALATVGITALANITNRAVDAGVRIAKSLTLDPVMDGFREYETNMTSIQTILSNTAAKGTKLTDVNAALDELNHYADLTIYNFSQMARNVGTFTAAGVDLGTATASIKGIANIAALSGSSADQASVAMYQLSQAIAAGSVKLMDWNSVVNAGMGGEVLQKALFETGKALGTLKDVPVGQSFDQWKKAGNSFRQSLSDTASEGESTASRVAKANKDAAEQIADAERRSAESVQNANTRVTEARTAAAKTATTTARDIADAEKSRTDTATKSAEDIAKAEKYQADAFEAAAQEVARAVESQNRTVEEGAANVQKAMDAVRDAKRRLDDALKPESTDKLAAANDHLKTTQLDQADLADAVTLAERDQQRSVEDLAAARAALDAAEASGTKSATELIAARRRVEDAETRVADLADAVERARLRQNQATREVTDAENQLTEAKNKGTEQDQRVIDARQSLADAEAAVVKAEQDAAQRNADAAKAVEAAEISASERRKAAVDGLAEAHAKASADQIAADQHVTDVRNRAADQISDAAKRVTDAEKAAAKAQVDAQRDVAKAHESAAERITAANKATGKAPEGWLTSQVLTNTLKAFTGDLTQAQLMAMGYTKDQADEMLKLGKIGQGAAQDVKTLTQLLSTVKENVGSGWAETFRIVFGTFDESKDLFTGVNNAIKVFADTSTNARNSVLADWKAAGGRTALLQALESAFDSLGKVLGTVKAAFREIFPKATGEDLLLLTARFTILMDALKPSEQTLNNLKRTFAGVFALLDIGWNVLKGVWLVFKDLLSVFTGAGTESLKFTANLGDMLVALDKSLVAGGKLHDFFQRLGEAIKEPLQLIKDFAIRIIDFFKGFSSATDAGGTTDHLTNSIGLLGDASKRLTDIWDRLSKIGEAVRQAFVKVWDYISAWLKDLGKNMANAFSADDFNGVVDLLNVGLLGGIIVMFKKFLNNMDQMGTGIVAQIKGSLEQVTKTLSAMQTQLKAKALMEIAIALGVLTASIVVLASIDSAALTKAMVAISIGFAQLVATMTALDKIVGSAGDAGKMGLVAISLNLVATSMVVLAGAIKILASMSWEEMAKGMGGLAAGLALMLGAMEVISTDPAGLISSSVAMTAMATSMVILAGAVKAFATMSWGDMAKGLVGVAGGLGLIVLAMQVVPIGQMLAAGVAMIPLATGLVILAGAVKLFATMDWGQIGKGLVGLAGALVIVALAMNLMPLTLPITAVGMVILSAALVTLAGAVALMGNMKLGTLAKGLGGFAAMLLILVVAVNAMSGAMAGAAALIVVAGAMAILAKVLETIGKLSLKELAIGLGGMAAALLLLAGAAIAMQPIIPALLALGIALGVVGVAFVLFGAGAFLIAKAFEAMAAAGKAGTAAVIDSLMMLIKALPGFVAALLTAVVKMGSDFLDSMEVLLKIVAVVLVKILDTVIELAPKIAQAILAIVTQALILIREKIPDIIETGFVVLTALLKGLLDHMDDVATLAIKIIIKLAGTLTDNIKKLTDAGVNLILGFLGAIADRGSDIAGAGLGVLLALIKGMADNVVKILDMAVTIVIQFATAIGSNVERVVSAGATLLIKLLEGITNNLHTVSQKGVDVIVAFLNAIGQQAVSLARGAADALVNFLNGLAIAIREKDKDIRDAGKNIATAIISGITMGLSDHANEVIDALTALAGKGIDAFLHAIHAKSPSRLFMTFGGYITQGLAIGIDKDDSAENSAVASAERIVAAFQRTLNDVPNSLEGLDASPVIRPVLDLTEVKAAAQGLDSLFQLQAITPEVSIAQARLIATTTDVANKGNPEPAPAGPTELKFEQNIYSPTALSTNDIYRSTRSQIALAKEELSIP